MSTVKLFYFAWIRERVGVADESVTLPAELNDVGDLLSWLKTRGEGYAAALEFPEIVRVAVDQHHVDHQHPISNAREIALFPPMTGG